MVAAEAQHRLNIRLHVQTQGLIARCKALDEEVARKRHKVATLERDLEEEKQLRLNAQLARDLSR